MKTYNSIYRRKYMHVFATMTNFLCTFFSNLCFFLKGYGCYRQENGKLIPKIKNLIKAFKYYQLLICEGCIKIQL